MITIHTQGARGVWGYRDRGCRARGCRGLGGYGELGGYRVRGTVLGGVWGYRDRGYRGLGGDGG